MEKPANVVCEGGVCRFVGDAPATGGPGAGSGGQAALLDMLGDVLLKNGGDEKVPTSSILGPNKIVSVYFSAHWCPPCRGFTPMLAEIYKKFKASHPRKDDWEVVFVSSDRDEASFKEYFGEMPWLAQPWGGDLKRKLNKKFKVQGIPTLIVLDGATGQLITGNGREVVMEDQECESFPWRPLPFKEVVAGPITDKNGGKFTEADLLGKPLLIYFSAHWCPPCRGFTPVLSKLYEKLKADGKEFELLFVSSDKSEEQWKEYYNEMPGWKLLPLDDKKRKNALSSMFEVEGIPSLVLVGADGKVVTTNARSMVRADPEGELFPNWAPQPVAPLDDASVERLNESPCVLLFYPTSSDDLKAKAEGVLKGPAAAAKAVSDASDGEVEPFSFLYGAAEGGHALVANVLGFLQAGTPPAGSCLLVLLDVPEQCKYTKVVQGEVTAAEVEKVVAEYRAGSLATEALSD